MYPTESDMNSFHNHYIFLHIGLYKRIRIYCSIWHETADGIFQIILWNFFNVFNSKNIKWWVVIHKQCTDICKISHINSFVYLFFFQKHNSPLQAKVDLVILFHLILPTTRTYHRRTPIDMRSFSTSSIQCMGGWPFCLTLYNFWKNHFFGALHGNVNEFLQCTTFIQMQGNMLVLFLQNSVTTHVPLYVGLCWKFSES